MTRVSPSMDERSCRVRAETSSARERGMLTEKSTRRAHSTNSDAKTNASATAATVDARRARAPRPLSRQNATALPAAKIAAMPNAK